QISFEIIGVTSAGFSGETVGEAPDVWVPITRKEAIFPGAVFLSASQDGLNEYMWLQVIARGKPGVTLEQAKARINVTFPRMLESELGSELSAEERKGLLD